MSDSEERKTEERIGAFEVDYQAKTLTAVSDELFRRKRQLSVTQKECLAKHGILIVSGEDMFGSQEKLKSFVAAALQVTECEERVDGPWMYYNMQQSDANSTLVGRNNGRILSRIEKFCDYYEPMEQALSKGALFDVVSQLFGEKAALYKEKINMKYPKDNGFDAHQDHAAGWWKHGHSIHLNAFVALDDCTVQNGCLQCVLGWGFDNRELVSEKFKGIPKYCEELFEWYNVLMKSGDTLFFTSYVPHRSFVNHTEKPRRVLLGTWNKLAEGDKRKDYYDDKEKSFPPDILRLDKTKKFAYKI